MVTGSSVLTFDPGGWSTDCWACPRRRLTQGGVRTVGAQEMDFTGLNETAIWAVFSP